MGVYIKVIGSSVDNIAGTEANEFMLFQGYFEYDGIIPNQPIELLLYDEEKKELIVNQELLNEKLSLGVSENIKTLESLHEEFLNKLIGENTISEVSSWEFKFKLANDLEAGKELTKEQDTYLTYAGIKSKKAKTAWQTKVLSKSISTRASQGAADLIRSNFKKAIKEVDHLDKFREVIDAARLEFNTKYEELKNLV